MYCLRDEIYRIGTLTPEELDRLLTGDPELREDMIALDELPPQVLRFLLLVETVLALEKLQ